MKNKKKLNIDDLNLDLILNNSNKEYNKLFGNTSISNPINIERKRIFRKEATYISR